MSSWVFNEGLPISRLVNFLYHEASPDEEGDFSVFSSGICVSS